MTPTTENSGLLSARHRDWIERATALVDQIAGWAEALGWKVNREEKTISEKWGSYPIPALHIHPPQGELLVNPIALQVAGGNGRIDLEAVPTLSRVKFLGTEDGWRIMTDSNVPLRIPWNRESFIQLANDLLA